MTWATLIPLIAQYGLPWAFSFWQIVTQHPEPTEEAWTKLLALSQKPMLEYINESRARVGLPPLTSYDPGAPPAPPAPPA